MPIALDAQLSANNWNADASFNAIDHVNDLAVVKF